MNKAHRELLKKNYEDACTAYVKAMLESFDVDERECWWVADEIGGVFMVGDMLSLDMQEIVYIVDNNIPYDDCVDWEDYCLFAKDFNQTVPSLVAWSKGCPRLSKSEQQKLIDLKKDFDYAVKDYKERY